MDSSLEPSPEAAGGAAPPNKDYVSWSFNWRKLIISCFIVWQIICVVLWLMPDEAVTVHGTLIPIISPYMLATGTWQAWTMFSPNPAQLDAYVEAKIFYADGTRRSWLFPRDSQMGYIQRYRRERFRKMIENLHPDGMKKMWPFLARYAAIENDRAGDPKAYPMKVWLVRHFRIVNAPPAATLGYKTYTFYQTEFDKSPQQGGEAISQ